MTDQEWADRALQLLKDLECGIEKLCSCCGNWPYEEDGHKRDCELAALLEAKGVHLFYDDGPNTFQDRAGDSQLVGATGAVYGVPFEDK